jgi:cytochrome oxidase assembly protein ShyY1
MPQHYQYVFAAYGLWVVTFAVYLVYLRHKARAARRALARMQGGERSAGP